MDGNILIELFKYLGDEVLLQKVSPVYFVYGYQRGILLRNGVYKKDVRPGVNYKFPVIDRFHVVNSAVDTVKIDPIPIVTHDGQQVSVRPILKIRITSAKANLYDTNDALSNLKDVAGGVIANYLTDCDWKDIKDKSTLTKIKNTLKNECAEIGYLIEKVYFERIVTTRVFTVFKE